MNLRDQIRKAKNADADKPDPDLIAHMESLGLKTVDDYVAWCALHGFGRRTSKNWRQRLKERAFFTQAAAVSRLARKKRELRSPQQTIERIFHGEFHEHDLTQPHLKAICRAFEAVKSRTKTRQALFDLLLHVSRHSELLDVCPVVPEYGRQEGNTYIAALLALARNAAGWLRQPLDWAPRTHNAGRQFAGLARHLFAHWPVPSFMDSVWFKGDGDEALRQQSWFLHVGRGENIRTTDLPLPFTKRMAHHFMQAPSDLTMEGALRWGQIRGLGGDERLVRKIIGTRLGSSFEHDDFWITVLRFFIANPMLDAAHIGPIVDYIHSQRFVSSDVFVGPGVIEHKPPPQPNLSMQGRTPESLLRQVQVWHHGLAKVQQPQADWPRSGIVEFEFVEGSERGANLKIWTITELLSTRALVAEGRKMKHCVATYAGSCAHGQTSIWTLEVESFEGRSKLLTIEVRNSARLICQVRGKCNALPAEKHRGIIRRWAEQAGLQLATYV